MGDDAVAHRPDITAFERLDVETCMESSRRLAPPCFPHRSGHLVGTLHRIGWPEERLVGKLVDVEQRAQCRRRWRPQIALTDGGNEAHQRIARIDDDQAAGAGDGNAGQTSHACDIATAIGKAGRSAGDNPRAGAWSSTTARAPVDGDLDHASAVVRGV